MIKLDFAHICDLAFFTDGTNNPNIIGMFEGISASKFPALHPRFSVLAKIIGEPNKSYTYKFKVVNITEKNNVVIESNEGNFSIGNKSTHYLLHHFLEVVFNAAGEHEVQVIIDNKVVGIVNFNVKLT